MTEKTSQTESANLLRARPIPGNLCSFGPSNCVNFDSVTLSNVHCHQRLRCLHKTQIDDFEKNVLTDKWLPGITLDKKMFSSPLRFSPQTPRNHFKSLSVAQIKRTLTIDDIALVFISTNNTNALQQNLKMWIVFWFNQTRVPHAPLLLQSSNISDLKHIILITICKFKFKSSGRWKWWHFWFNESDNVMTESASASTWMRRTLTVEENGPP